MSNRLFAIIPLPLDREEEALPYEIMVDRNTGMIYIKGADGLPQSATEDMVFFMAEQVIPYIDTMKKMMYGGI